MVDTKWYAYLWASTRGVYEVAFVLLPVIVWSIALISVGSADQIGELAAWPFAALALYSSTLRDGIKAYKRESLDDKRTSGLLVVVALFGVVISSVLLTLAVLKSAGQIDYLFSFFYSLVWLLFWFGLLLLLAVKVKLSLRDDFSPGV